MDNNKYKRMAKNAGMLYVRMLLTMAVTLYTSRVVLKSLGVNDFGIYSVVAGFVTMLGFLNSAMSSATQRFLAFELGKSGDKDIRRIFSMSVNIHLFIAVFVLLLGETVGLWFVKTQMSIPVDRLAAAQWVFHFALLSFMITIISVPYNALIIAHERMSVFAWVSVIDVMLKLLIVFMLGWFGIDKLMLYSMLSLAVVFIMFMVYRIYCRVYFLESHFRLYWDKQLFRTMLSYTGWNLWGNIAAVMSGQGVNILLNIFFGPSVNAARAIAMQVSGALNSFVQNLQVAINPQIIKSYAAKDMIYMHKLVCYGAKYNFFLLLFLSAPVLINIELILNFWLEDAPNYTTSFVFLLIINFLIDSVSAPLITAAQATGRIKIYQIVVGGVLLLNLPISYFILSFEGNPGMVVFAGIVTSLIALGARLMILNKTTLLPISNYLKEVVGRSILVAGFVGAAYYTLFQALSGEVGLLLGVFYMMFCVLLAVFLFGLDHIERRFIVSNLGSRIRNYRF